MGLFIQGRALVPSVWKFVFPQCLEGIFNDFFHYFPPLLVYRPLWNTDDLGVSSSDLALHFLHLLLSPISIILIFAIF